MLNGKRYMCLSPELTPGDENSIKEAIRRYDRMAVVSKVTQHDGFALAMLGDILAAQYYLDWHK